MPPWRVAIIFIIFHAALIIDAFSLFRYALILYDGDGAALIDATPILPPSFTRLCCRYAAVVASAAAAAAAAAAADGLRQYTLFTSCHYLRWRATPAALRR